MKTHKDLNVYQNSIDLVTDIYYLRKSFPGEEQYGLTSQIRRSAVSVPSNISEGAARKNKTEFIQFLYIALGSLSELETQLIISKNLGYVKKTDDLIEKITDIRKMIFGLVKSIKSKS
ncbi:MAG: four helix bundle protein [Candidatus Marinimicrobia bacterium]|jgi:four helix bundle protein|nr:four helix bundle protein [Candidatus Neomarinimicrobiota bacterium]MBT6356476.1 four helix bundle protein [Chloroflexota bacterium]MBT6937373.1 four helix bundle protein [Candidatus Neomarinimicrobiota bacterium]